MSSFYFVCVLQERAGVKMMMIQDGPMPTGADKPLRISGDPYKVQVCNKLTLPRDPQVYLQGLGMLHQSNLLARHQNVTKTSGFDRKSALCVQVVLGHRERGPVGLVCELDELNVLMPHETHFSRIQNVAKTSAPANGWPYSTNNVYILSQ